MSQTCIQLDLGMKLDKPSNLKTLWCHSCRLFKLQSFNKPFPPQWSRCNHEHWWLWAVAAATRLKPRTWSGLGLADDSEGQPFHPSTLVFHCHTGGLRLWRFQLGHQLMHSWFEPRPRGTAWRWTSHWALASSWIIDWAEVSDISMEKRQHTAFCGPLQPTENLQTRGLEKNPVVLIRNALIN